MIVMKFGGTSVGNAESIAKVANIIKNNLNKKPVAVVSAVTKITDALIKLANECKEGMGEETLHNIKKIHYRILEKLSMDNNLIKNDIDELENLVKEINPDSNLDKKTIDHFQSFGERMSSKIVAAQLIKVGVESKSFNAWDLGFLTDSEFGNAEPLKKAYQNLNKSIKHLEIVPVITGFIGRTEQGEITTLGRGGSDYTAAIVGAAIDAEEIQIWTDVDGIMSSDPKIVGNAKTLDNVSFAEASELAYFGARVLHPKTILPAMDKNIPVRVLNTFNPSGKGTIILKEANGAKQIIKAIACKKNITLINVDSTRMLGASGFLARLFDIFKNYRKSIDVVSTSEVSVSLTVDDDQNLQQIFKELEEIASIEVSKNKAIICVVGERMQKTPGVSGRTFMALGNNHVNIEMISQGASEINITFIVDGKDADNAVKALHKEFFG